MKSNVINIGLRKLIKSLIDYRNIYNSISYMLTKAYLG